MGLLTGGLGETKAAQWAGTLSALVAVMAVTCIIPIIWGVERVQIFTVGVSAVVIAPMVACWIYRPTIR
ncbi:MAG: hypothetical protein LBE86_02855 [Gemmobacter sp.]|jgi:multisubunit Na+/H+ antiporter MnhG subunit|nr:hypothetical protein [Gemmobacter sp.]